MSDEEKSLIKAFVQNQPMFEAVRRTLLIGMIGKDGTDFTKNNWVFGIKKDQTDAAFAKEVKVTMKALEWINAGFNDLARIGAASSPQVSAENQAR